MINKMSIAGLCLALAGCSSIHEVSPGVVHDAVVPEGWICNGTSCRPPESRKDVEQRSSAWELLPSEP